MIHDNYCAHSQAIIFRGYVVYVKIFGCNALFSIELISLPTHISTLIFFRRIKTLIFYVLPFKRL